MVVSIVDDAEADALLHASADATRRDILRRAVTGELSVSALARCYSISVTAVEKHVGVLERAGLVVTQPHGRESLVRTQVSVIRDAAAVLDELETVWRGRIDRMDDLLADPDN